MSNVKPLFSKQECPHQDRNGFPEFPAVYIYIYYYYHIIKGMGMEILRDNSILTDVHTECDIYMSV